MNRDEIDREISLLEARETTYANCEKLATLYIVRDHLTPQRQIYAGKTDFSRCCSGKCAEEVWAVVEELVETLRIVQPKAYQSIIERIEKI